MSGHSKWHNIQVRKGKQDTKRANIFTKLARIITVAAKQGGGDTTANFKLRLAIDKAKQSSMPKDNIQRAIDKGTGKGGGEELHEIAYEGKGPGGIDIIVELLTDSKNRTASEVKHIFTKNVGMVGAPGSVSWNFVQKGLIVISEKGEDKVLEAMGIDGVEDVEEDEGGINIYTKPKELAQVNKALESKGYKIEKAEIFLDPKNTVKLDENKSDQALKLLEALDEYDDTQNVYTNME